MKPPDRKQVRHKWNLPAYVILNKKLYKVLVKNKANDRTVLWNFEEHKREVHSYSAVAQYGEKAYSFWDISQMLERSPNTLKFRRHEFPEGYRIYTMTDHKPHGWRFDAEQVMEIREVLANTHYGRPRADGEIIPRAIPSRAELKAMLQQEAVYYVQGKDGKFVPTWKAHQF